MVYPLRVGKWVLQWPLQTSAEVRLVSQGLWNNDESIIRLRRKNTCTSG